MTEATPTEEMQPKTAKRAVGVGRGHGGGRPVTRRAIGRTPTYTKEIGLAICKEVSNGLPMDLACRCLGISTDTAQSWKIQGINKPRSIFSHFSRNLERARGYAAKKRVARITASAKGGAVTARRISSRIHADGTKTETTDEKRTAPQWQADAWVLARTEPELFGDRKTIDHTGQATVDVNVQRTLNPADLASLAGLLGKVLTGGPLILDAASKTVGKSLAGPLNGLDGTTDQIGNRDVLQSVAPSTGDV
jgi:hypothetical protein